MFDTSTYLGNTPCKAPGRHTICPLSRLQIKVRPKGLRSFAFYFLIFVFSFLPLMSLRANTYVPIRHHLYNCRESSTNQTFIMQNKANFRKSQMNVSSVLTKDYENRTLGERGKNKANSKPIKPNTNPIQTQFTGCSNERKLSFNKGL